MELKNIRKANLAAFFAERKSKGRPVILTHMKNIYGIDGSYISRILRNEGEPFTDKLVNQLLTAFPELPKDYFDIDRTSNTERYSNTTKVVPLLNSQTELKAFIQGSLNYGGLQKMSVDQDLYTCLLYTSPSPRDS